MTLQINLITKTIFKSWLTYILLSIGFVISIIIFLIFDVIGLFKTTYILAVVLYIPIFIIGAVILPIIINKFSTHNIDLKFFTFNNRVNYYFLFFLYFISLELIMYILNLLISIAIIYFIINPVNKIDLYYFWHNPDYFGIIYCTIICCILTTLIGLITGILFDIKIIQIIYFSLIIFNIFFAYWIIPFPFLLIQNSGWFLWISYLNPYSYISLMYLESYNCYIPDINISEFNSTIFNIDSSYFILLLKSSGYTTYIELFTARTKIVNLLLPSCFIFVLFICFYYVNKNLVNTYEKIK